ncbi:endonuclease/exonuclease/phosphatase family protein [Telluribacter sp.]|jgi:endonuclease/exonuclease/phosphatase (EEP) superfamily protein YafD|uniref:endonuclease/exonuclease/phosphatase family protein n=1 Tax=Telluribacter sp. TaxID=1978767 RepID=UPI002E14CE6F|nr:endonuclease/exonuclease/phosphatase family protein [Telluribacter sp.]
MRLITGGIWFLYKLFVVYTLVVYALCYWMPSSHWLAGFMMISFPVVLVGQIIFLGFWLVLQPARAVVPVVLLLASFPFLERTYKLSAPEGALATAGAPALKIVNYNIAGFQLYDDSEPFTEQVLSWLKQTNPDVICLQEFSNRKNKAGVTTLELMKKAGYPHHVALTRVNDEDPSYVSGVITFSKYPIVASKDAHFASQNGMVQTDIRWRGKIIRIINVHLYSMTLKLNKLASQKGYVGVKRETRGTLRQMKKGFVERNDEVNQLDSWITESEYPVVVCGDFNETPYSYVYGRLRGQLANAFEVQGRGFGFSYNRLPYFIRIDHQFYSRENLRLQDFQTMRKIPYSDHYPLVGTYTLAEPE